MLTINRSHPIFGWLPYFNNITTLNPILYSVFTILYLLYPVKIPDPGAAASFSHSTRPPFVAVK